MVWSTVLILELALAVAALVVVAAAALTLFQRCDGDARPRQHLGARADLDRVERVPLLAEGALQAPLVLLSRLERVRHRRQPVAVVVVGGGGG